MQCFMELYHVDEMAKNLVAIALDCPTGREVVFTLPDEERNDDHPDVIENQKKDDEDNDGEPVNRDENEDDFDTSKLNNIDRSVYEYYHERRKIKIINDGQKG